MKSTVRKITFTAIVVFITSSLLLTGCSKKKEDVKQDAFRVEVSQVSLGDIDEVSTYTGRIKALKEVKVVSKIPGRIAYINADVGDFVEKGTQLVTLETDELQAQMGQAQAAVAAARANLNANQGGALPQQLEQTRAALRQAEANFQNAKADYERIKALYQEEAISKQSFDAMELKYSVAKTQYDTAKEQLKLTEQRIPSNIEALKAQVGQAEAAVRLIQANLENSVITAPVSGIITSKMAEPGEMASAGYPLAVVMNIDQVEAVINVSDDDVGRVQMGQEIDVKVQALCEEGELKGIVSNISPASDQTRLFQVKIKIDNRDHKLKPGMFAEVNLKLGTKQNVIAIPKDAVIIKKHRNAVYVVEENKAVEKLIEIGVSHEDKVEVKDGLSEGEILVVKGQNLLSDGVTVKYEK
jgi:HlyD family secretion protein